MKVEIKEYESIPAGVYEVLFDGAEKFESQYGEGLRWGFVIKNGPHKEKRVTKLTAVHASHKNSCGKMLSSIVGCLDASKDLDDYVGRSYHVKLGVKENGFSEIEALWMGNNQPDLAVSGAEIENILRNR